jgi:hypothetical protein
MTTTVISGFTGNKMILFTIGTPLTGAGLPKSITKIFVMDVITRIARTLVVHKISTYFFHIE